LKNNLPESKGYYDLAVLLSEESSLVKAACEVIFIQQQLLKDNRPADAFRSGGFSRD